MFAKLEKILRHVGVGCIILLFILMIVQVLLRYGFGYTHFLTEELGRYLLIWATLAGMALECGSGGHIRVAFLVDKLPATVKAVWETVVNLIVIALFFLIIYTGIESTIFNHGQESPGLQIPLSLPFAAIPVFFTIAVVLLGRKIWRDRMDRT